MTAMCLQGHVGPMSPILIARGAAPVIPADCCATCLSVPYEGGCARDLADEVVEKTTPRLVEPMHTLRLVA